VPEPRAELRPWASGHLELGHRAGRGHRAAQITFNVSLPAPIPSAADVCPNKQWTVVVFHVDYNDVVLRIQQNGVDLLTDGPNDSSTIP
jgi:hypothetical protein